LLLAEFCGRIGGGEAVEEQRLVGMPFDETADER
jgi:hypothetical protein